MLYLSETCQGRDNNLNLIRVLAAIAVLVSHAYPIALGPGTPEPLLQTLERSLGTLAVEMFFIISGFLIAQSYDRSSSNLRFAIARVLRLWPALIVSIGLVALPMGFFVTTLTPGQYLGSSETWSFIARNLTLISVQYELPGVFQQNPFTGVEGSIWTLIHEVACYVGLFMIGVLGLLRRKAVMAAMFTALLLFTFAVNHYGIDLNPKVNKFLPLAVAFGIGTAFYIWRDGIGLSVLVMCATIGLAIALRTTPVYDFVFKLALAYTVFWLAYVPSGVLRLYNHVGDYSYGIYIYAFPVQGLVVWLFGPMTPLTNMAIALPMTLIPSILSWHLIEAPALKLKSSIATSIEAITGRRSTSP
jgi:peptidoglycan/LPS O-acetylase OafA/YrhL